MTGLVESNGYFVAQLARYDRTDQILCVRLAGARCLGLHELLTYDKSSNRT